MRSGLLILITVLLFTSCRKDDLQTAENSGGQAPKNNAESISFLSEIKQLQNGQIDSLNLKPAERIKINPLAGNVSEIASEEAEKSEILLDDYQPLTKADILKVTGNYIFTLLHNKYSDEIRAATFSPDGKPLETVLLFHRFGNNEFKISRAYSYETDIPYFYDSSKNEFKFTDLRYDTEWIEYPVNGKDTLTYKIDFKVQVDEKGHFKVAQ